MQLKEAINTKIGKISRTAMTQRDNFIFLIQNLVDQLVAE